MILLIVITLLTANAEGRLQFLALGDWGDNSLTRQGPVADAMDAFCATEQCDFIVSTGDNFYDNGATSPDDPQFDEKWRDVYTGENVRDLTWYISMGNHDHTVTRNELNMVEFAETEERWFQPWLWYDEYFTVDEEAGTQLHLITIDSEAMWTRKYNASLQEAWLEETLASSHGDYVVVLAHHPTYSTGDYFGNVAIRPFLDEMFAQYQVDVYLTGHDHNLQRIKAINASVADVDHVVSGGGGRRPYGFSNINNNLINNAGYESLYFGEYNGFTALSADAAGLTVRHVRMLQDEAGGPGRPETVYSFTRPPVRGRAL